MEQPAKGKRFFEKHGCKHLVLLQGGEQEQLKEFDIPKEIVFVNSLPHRPGTDKINYQELEKIALDMVRSIN